MCFVIRLQNTFYFMDHPSFLAIQQSKFGKGLFATKDIAANTVLCTVTGQKLTFQQTIALNERESHSLQIGLDQYILCDSPFLYSNHSCEPNCALNAQLQLFALQDLKKGEELFWDYSTSMLERHWTMKCSCGSKHCRRLITDFDLLPETLQAIYLEKGIVLPFIAAQLQAYSKVKVFRA